MADRGDTHYHVPNLNNWFLISSLVFLIATVWMVIDDWDREWKQYQRGFRELDLKNAEEQLEAFEAQGVLAREEELSARVAAAEDALDDKRDELREVEKEAYDLKEARYRVEERFKSVKAVLGWDRYGAEADILDDEIEVIAASRDLDEVAKEMRELELEFQDADAEFQDATERFDALRAEVSAAEKALSKETADLTRVRNKIDQLDPSALTVQAANVVRDFPGLDFIGPNLKVDKQVLSDLTFELNFTKKTRIDMCTTCHMGADREGFEGAEQPYTTHPRLDLYLTSKSPHPVKEVGCTICHRGSGEALSFQRADHRPSNAEEADAWYEKYHWHKQHHWDYPMLESDKVEASCVQCHKTSMELIADDAPHVTEGYRNFERYGCYACHKVEWFPTKRRPGPSLQNLQAKLTAEFVDSWIAAPKSFRPTTWMPQLFHLENYPADETVVVSNYGDGREIKGQEWSETAVAAISAYLFDNHPEQELEPVPVEGDSERGREVFRLTGCLACHNMAPYPGEEVEEMWAVDPAFTSTDENEFGPNLRGVATKLDRTWLYWWLKDPKTYWPDTRMPDLRLSEQDAADITAYLMDDPDGVFHDTPDGWQPERSTADAETLHEQARWFFDKLGRREIARRLAGENPEHRWDQQNVLAAVVGEALVRNHGCYSCHEIAGLENEMPIGTELTNWGSKTVDKLDFAMSYQKELAGLPKLDNYYREGWIERKMHRPRSYDIDKIKNPKEKLRMPWFDFTDREVETITTFTVGLVDDEVQRAKMEPTPEQLSMDVGLRAIRQNNCMACHETEPGSITFEHEVNGEPTEVTVFGELKPLTDEIIPPRLDDLASLQQTFANWEEDFEEELEDVTILLLDANADVGASNEKVTITPDKLVAVTPPKGGDFVRLVTEYYYYGANVADPEAAEDEDPWFPWTAGYDDDTGESLIEDVDGVQRAYGEENYEKVRWTFAPPVLWNEGYKVQREWFYSFLKDPVPLRQQLRVRMPSFYYEPGEAEAIADYFANQARENWYGRYARALRLTLGRTTRDVASSATWTPADRMNWPSSLIVTEDGPGLSIAEVAGNAGVTPDILRAIERGSKVETKANFHKVFDWGVSQGFGFPAQVSESYELIQRRTPSHLADRQRFIPMGDALAEKGVNCYSCHPNNGVFPETPIAWAPDLSIARERLREEWVMEWLQSPPRMYPGTSMPENFSADAPQYQELFPNSGNQDQIRAVMDWLFNLDRAPSIAD